MPCYWPRHDPVLNFLYSTCLRFDGLSHMHVMQMAEHRLLRRGRLVSEPEVDLLDMLLYGARQLGCDRGNDNVDAIGHCHIMVLTKPHWAIEEVGKLTRSIVARFPEVRQAVTCSGHTMTFAHL